MNILAQAKHALPVKDPNFDAALQNFGATIDNFGAPLDTSHKIILYVEGVTVSFDGFRRLGLASDY
ncbi:MAG: hypothetical protein EOO68_20790, partial [Moraxellaceae bacterium]